VWFTDYTASASARHASAPNILGQFLASSDSSPHSTQANTYDWIVRFDSAAVAGINSAAQIAGLLAGGPVQFEVLRGLGMQGQVLVRSYGASLAAAAARLNADSRVANYELDGQHQVESVPNDANFSSLWGLRNTGQNSGTAGDDIRAADAWNLTTGSRNVVVAVIDTGVDYNHSDLAANMWTNPNEAANNGAGFVGDVHGYNFFGDNGNPFDDNGHGTHVAGTIGAVGNNGRGVTGVNWAVSIMALKTLGADGSGYTSDAIRAVNYATMMRTQYGVNVRVINASWGGTGADAELDAAIRAAGAAGILFVSAAGNAGTNNDATPTYPANTNSSNVIAVAATDNSDRLAYFSNYGVRTVALAAPGVSIYSTAPGGAYRYMSGTSMATPHVAGVAALAWSLVPNATVAQVRDALIRGVDQVPSLAGKVASGGRLNAVQSLRLLQPSNSPTPAIASLLATPSAIDTGSPVTLTASGVAEAGGTIAGVYFYQDANANAQWDPSDRLLGSTRTIANGQAAISVSTAGMTAGTYRFFARALDGQGQWSAAATTQVTLTQPNQRGTGPGNALPLAVDGSVRGEIDDQENANWYKLQVVAGKNYVFQTGLDTLYDSVLRLYDASGQRLLATNDDAGPGDYSSRLAWRATFSGTCYVTVASYPASGGGSYRLSVTSPNTAPSLAAVPNQTMTAGRTLSVTLRGADADGDRLRYVAQALTPGAGTVAVGLSGNVLTVRPAAWVRGRVQVVATVSDGTLAVSRTITVTVNAPVVTPRSVPAADPSSPRSVVPVPWRRSANSPPLLSRSVDLAFLAGAAAHPAQKSSHVALDALARDMVLRACLWGR
jgi:subtilisin family serine protease